MGRPYQPPQPRKISGKIEFVKPDGVFLGALDIKDYVPLRVRIAEVVEYPAGTVRGGHAVREPFLAVFYEARSPKGEWKRARKPLPLNRTNHMALFTRFGEDASWWEGMEITLVLEPTHNPGRGAKVVAGIRIAPEADEATEEQLAEKLRRALRHECPYERAPERQPGDDSEPFVPDTDIPPDDGPPPDWQGSVHAAANDNEADGPHKDQEF